MKQLSLTPTINGSVTAAILHSRRTKLKKMAPNLIKLAAGGVDSTVENFCSLPFALEDHKLTISGHTILSDVPSNIIVTPYGGGKGVNVPGCFIGFDSDGPKSHHVVSLGKLVGIKFMSIFRFKVWWTTLWVGDKGSDLEHETQIALLDRSESGRPYVLLLPLIEGRFRASLQPGDNENVDLCVESSSTLVVNDSFRSSLYVHAGNDPYVLIKDAIKVVREFLGTFKLLDEKTPPAIVDKFGWCTWDAFYLKVHPQGVWDGVKELAAGGCPPGMVLIDDGWQSICHDDDPITDQEGMNRTSAGEQMPCRLIKFQENYKFRDYESPFDGEKGMAKFTRDLKNTFKTVDHIYVWHALCGYWGGIRPGVPEMPEATVIEPKLTPGLKMTMEDLAVDKIVNNGVGLVPPEKASQMYEGLHSHLKDVGIDGVKVDVIHLLEMLCENYGGRVELAKTYYKAISESVKKYLHGNGVIASMEHCNDFMFLGTETISLGRVGDDFWCTDPSGDPNGTFWLQGCHMVHCAYNSLWMGNFIHPDWDMFQSTHPCAIFHAASRAISGGPIYISDSVGEHDFPLIKSLALPDGTILRCDYYALPTRDCLFEDPLHDGKTMLKIWNLNKFTGVVGAFNCQGGGWSREARRNKCASEFSKPVTSTINPKDVEWTNGKKPISIEGVEQFAAFSFLSQQLVLLNPTEIIPISLKPFHFELFTISPIKSLPFKPIQFAPIGLINMLNSGGAIKSLKYGDHDDSVSIEVRGTGEMRVFSSEKPKSCTIDGEEVAFDYDNKMVVIQVPWNSVSSGISVIDYLY